MAKTTIEKITSVEEQIKQLENQRKQLVQQQKEQERKARTKRLIERGAIVESLIDSAESLTNEQFKAFLEKTIQTEYGRKILSGIKAQTSQAATSRPAGAEQSGGAATAQELGYSIVKGG